MGAAANSNFAFLGSHDRRLAVLGEAAERAFHGDPVATLVDFCESGIRLLKGVNVRDGWLAEDELDHWDAEDAVPYAQYRLSAGDIVIAMDRPVYSSGSRATKVVQLDAAWEGALLLQRVGRFRPVPSIDRRYLFRILSSAPFREHLTAAQNGTQDGKDLPHVSAGVVDAAIFPVPPLHEQRLMASRLDALLSRWSSFHESTRHAERLLTQLDASVLAKAFRGELTRESDDD